MWEWWRMTDGPLAVELINILWRMEKENAPSNWAQAHHLSDSGLKHYWKSTEPDATLEDAANKKAGTASGVSRNHSATRGITSMKRGTKFQHHKEIMNTTNPTRNQVICNVGHSHSHTITHMEIVTNVMHWPNKIFKCKRLEPSKQWQNQDVAGTRYYGKHKTDAGETQYI